MNGVQCNEQIVDDGFGTPLCFVKQEEKPGLKALCFWLIPEDPQETLTQTEAQKLCTDYTPGVESVAVKHAVSIQLELVDKFVDKFPEIGESTTGWDYSVVPCGNNWVVQILVGDPIDVEKWHSQKPVVMS